MTIDRVNDYDSQYVYIYANYPVRVIFHKVSFVIVTNTGAYTLKSKFNIDKYIE